MAGEFGHLQQMGGLGYAAGGGMLETYVGREDVLARYRHHGGSSAASIQEILDSLARGEPAAAKTGADWGKWLGRGLSHVVNLLNNGSAHHRRLHRADPTRLLQTK